MHPDLKDEELKPMKKVSTSADIFAEIRAMEAKERELEELIKTMSDRFEHDIKLIESQVFALRKVVQGLVDE